MYMQNQFSDVTKTYLSCFYKILDDMIRGMTDADLNDSISHNFIVQMIPHHMAAIEMSRNLLQYTTFIPLQNIAQNIISEQTKSINDMNNVMKTCCEMNNTEGDLCMYQERIQKIMQNMFCRMRNAKSVNDINVNFMREMIPHHEGAIAMSETALCYPICSELVPILKAIIVSQRRGVREMKCLLRCV